jgi:hypothetical protein
MITKRLNNENGQAIFEMIIFLPFLIFLYTVFYTVGNSISASINQQKAVRGYFYQLVKGNSYIVSAVDLDSDASQYNIHTVGFFAIGWAEELLQARPVGNCFHFTSMLRNNSTEVCNSSVRTDPTASYIIRAFTMYGICGPVFEPPPSALVNGKKFVLDQARQMAKCELK